MGWTKACKQQKNGRGSQGLFGAEASLAPEGVCGAGTALLIGRIKLTQTLDTVDTINKSIFHVIRLPLRIPAVDKSTSCMVLLGTVELSEPSHPHGSLGPESAGAVQGRYEHG